MIVIVNNVPGQGALARDFCRNMGYGFISLECDMDWTRNVYKIPGTPANYLLGRDGRRYFAPGIEDTASARTLELLIETLLDNTTEWK